MKAFKGAIVVAAILATVAVAACRREEHHEALKLGGPVSTEVAR